MTNRLTLEEALQQDRKGFDQWYLGWAKKTGIDPNPDDPRHKYNYRAAYAAGAEPTIDPQDGLYHWPSQFKEEDHPNRFVDGEDTLMGRRLTLAEAIEADKKEEPRRLTLAEAIQQDKGEEPRRLTLAEAIEQERSPRVGMRPSKEALSALIPKEGTPLPFVGKHPTRMALSDMLKDGEKKVEELWKKMEEMAPKGSPIPPRADAPGEKFLEAVEKAERMELTTERPPVEHRLEVGTGIEAKKGEGISAPGRKELERATYQPPSWHPFDAGPFFAAQNLKTSRHVVESFVRGVPFVGKMSDALAEYVTGEESWSEAIDKLHYKVYPHTKLVVDGELVQSETLEHGKDIFEKMGYWSTLIYMGMALGPGAAAGVAKPSLAAKMLQTSTLFGTMTGLDEFAKLLLGDEDYKGAIGVRDSMLGGAGLVLGLHALGIAAKGVVKPSLKYAYENLISGPEKRALAKALHTTVEKMDKMSDGALRGLVSKAVGRGELKDKGEGWMAEKIIRDRAKIKLAAEEFEKKAWETGPLKAVKGWGHKKVGEMLGTKAESLQGMEGWQIKGLVTRKAKQGTITHEQGDLIRAWVDKIKPTIKVAPTPASVVPKPVVPPPRGTTAPITVFRSKHKTGLQSDYGEAIHFTTDKNAAKTYAKDYGPKTGEVVEHTIPAGTKLYNENIQEGFYGVFGIGKKGVQKAKEAGYVGIIKRTITKKDIREVILFDMPKQPKPDPFTLVQKKLVEGKVPITDIQTKTHFYGLGQQHVAMQASDAPLTPAQDTSFKIWAKQLYGKVLSANVAKPNELKFLRGLSDKDTLTPKEKLKAFELFTREWKKRELGVVDKIIKRIAEQKGVPEVYRKLFREQLKGVALTDAQKKKLAAGKIFDPYGGSASEDAIMNAPSILFDSVKPGTPIGELNVTQLMQLRESLRLVHGLGSSGAKAIRAKERRAVEMLVRAFQENPPMKAKYDPEGVEVRGLKAFFRRTVRYPLDNMLTRASEMFGTNSRVTKILHKTLADGREADARMIWHSHRVSESLVKKYGLSEKALNNKAFSFVSGKGQKITMSYGEAFSFINTLGDQVTFNMMLDKGGTLPFELGKTAKGAKSVVIRELGAGDLKKVFELLPDKVTKMASEAQRDITSFGAKSLNDTLFKRTGQRIWINPTYWPRHAARDIHTMSDSDLRALLTLTNIGDTVEKMGIKSGATGEAIRRSQDMLKALSRVVLSDNMGILKARVSHEHPISLGNGLTVYRQYYRNLGGYVGREGPAHRVLSFLEHPSTGALARSIHKDGQRLLRDLKTDVVAWHGEVVRKGPIDKVFGWATDRLHALPLIANLNVVTNQPLSGLASILLYDKKAVVKAAAFSPKERKMIIDGIRKRSAHVDLRYTMSSVERLFPGYRSVKAPHERIGLAPVRWMDLKTIERTAFLPSYAEGQLKGLKGESLWKYAVRRGIEGMDKTAPTSDPLTTAPLLRKGRENLLIRTMFMFTSPTVKLHNFARQASIGLRDGALTRGEWAARVGVVRVGVPLLLYMKNFYLDKATTAGARFAGGKEGIWFDKNEADFHDHMFGIFQRAVGTQPVLGLSSPFFRFAYSLMRDRPTMKTGTFMYDRDIFRYYSNAAMALYKYGESLFDQTGTLSEAEERKAHALSDLLSDALSIAPSPYIGRLAREALPNKKHTRRFYYEMYYDAVAQREGPRAYFARQQLLRLGAKSTDVYRNLRNQAERDRRISLDWWSDAFSEELRKERDKKR